ncbi:hypothetical protein [Sporichthya polymorpha]|uniref:hypothetical protein n=1 Tax=Sporichthya polymorpha TaxID=35751 RepID=UPI00036D712D|nr:hypothetical protein [Sporichthya polymorpha]
MGPSVAPSLQDVVAALTFDAGPYLSCDECFDRLCAYVEQVATNRQSDPVMRRHVEACLVCGEDAQFLLEVVVADRVGGRAASNLLSRGRGPRAGSDARPAPRSSTR